MSLPTENWAHIIKIHGFNGKLQPGSDFNQFGKKPLTGQWLDWKSLNPKN